MQPVSLEACQALSLLGAGCLAAPYTSLPHYWVALYSGPSQPHSEAPSMLVPPGHPPLGVALSGPTPVPRATRTTLLLRMWSVYVTKVRHRQTQRCNSLFILKPRCSY